MIKASSVIVVLLLMRTTVAGQQRSDSAKASDTTKVKVDTAKAKSAAQNSAAIDSFRTRLTAIETGSNNVISFSIGLGYRWLGLHGYELFELSISPYDSTLQIDTLARASFVLSGMVTAQPFKGRVSNLLLIADVSLAEFAGNNAITVSNKALEGGGGLGWRINPNFSFGWTLERISRREPRAYLLKRLGQKVPGPNGVVTQISTTDNTFYRDANLAAFAIWFIYRFK
jgi:hypothetical protein